MTAETLRDALLHEWPFTMTRQTCCGFPHGEHSREDPSIYPAHERTQEPQEMVGIRERLDDLIAAARADADARITVLEAALASIADELTQRGMGLAAHVLLARFESAALTPEADR